MEWHSQRLGAQDASPDDWEGLPGPTHLCPTPLKGQGHRYLPDYRGSLLPSEQPPLLPRCSQRAPWSRRLQPMPKLPAGPPGCNRPPCLQEPSEPLLAQLWGGRPSQKQQQRRACALALAQHFLSLQPLKGKGGGRSCWLAKAAICSTPACPALLTGRRSGCCWGQRAPWLVTHAPRMGLSRWQAASRPGAQAGGDPSPDYRRVALPALLLSSFSPSSERRGKPRLSLYFPAERGPRCGWHRAFLSPLGNSS